MEEYKGTTNSDGIVIPKPSNIDLLGIINAKGGDNDAISQSTKSSSRKSDLPTKLKDYALDGNVKYGIKKVVNYSNLSVENFSFVINLDKTTEPMTFREVIIDSKWVDAINAEIEALNKNKTWEITDMPSDRRPI
ncbi:hypothetical protein Tco_0526177 [Tanacetum coccineum]